MYAPERHRRILSMLENEPMVRSRALEGALGVTAMTVWRDLTTLEEQGLLKRVRGGAVRAAPRDEEPAFAAKVDRARPLKEGIAVHAARYLIEPGDILIIDGGTTTAELARQPLPRRLTVLTNSLPIANHLLSHRAGPAVYLSGGLLRTESGTLVGRETLTFFSRRRAGKFFLSATALDAAGISDPNPQEIEVKQVMASSAERVVLLADSRKFGMRSLMQTLPWKRIDAWVTDAGIRGRLAEAGPLPIEPVVAGGSGSGG